MEYQISIIIISGIYVILALSFYIPLMTGQVSLAQAGFMSIGAYSSAICSVKFGIPYVPAVMIGGIMAAFFGLLLGLPALRIKGVYLLLLTLGFGEMVKVIAINIDYIGGASGMMGIPYQENSLYYVLGVIIILIIFFQRLKKSRMGRAFEAVGSDEDSAEVIGINIVSVKLTAFMAGAFLAGIAGGIFAHYGEYIEPLMFDVMHSIEPLIFTIFGGVQIFWGPIFGAVVLTIVPEFLRVIQDWRMEIYGVLLIVMMIFRPKGVIGPDTGELIKKIFKSILGENIFYNSHNKQAHKKPGS